MSSKKQMFIHCQTKLRVLLDLDQVLADFEGELLARYRKRYPDDPFIPLDERKGFYIKDQYEKIDKDLGEKVRSIYIEEGFFRSLPEVPGAISAAKIMAKTDDVDVFICTSPLTEYKYCLAEKFEWVEKHLGSEWLNNMIIAKDKTMVNGHILIDDRCKIDGKCKSPSWEHIVFTACHNKSDQIHGKRRLESWKDKKWIEIIEDFKKRI